MPHHKKYSPQKASKKHIARGYYPMHHNSLFQTSRHHHRVYRRIIYNAIILCLLFAYTTTSAEAQLLSAYDQAYGQWNIRLTKNIFGKGRWFLETIDTSNNGNGKRERNSRENEKESDLQLLFPRIYPQHYEETSELLQDESQSNDATISSSVATQIKKPSLKIKSVKSIPCILNLQKNGKFTLHIDDNTTKEQNNKQYNEHTTSPQIRHLPFQGEWYLTPNPYCVTDRQYDTITLLSQPRMRRVHMPLQSHKKGKSTIDPSTETESKIMIEKATVEMRCKLWGRYGGGSIRNRIGWGHGREMGRMTHGTVMITRERILDNGADGAGKGTNKAALPTKEIVGTFRGRACIDLDTLLIDDEDKRAFGKAMVDEDEEDVEDISEFEDEDIDDF